MLHHHGSDEDNIVTYFFSLMTMWCCDVLCVERHLDLAVSVFVGFVVSGVILGVLLKPNF